MPSGFALGLDWAREQGRGVHELAPALQALPRHGLDGTAAYLGSGVEGVSGGGWRGGGKTSKPKLKLGGYLGVTGK